MKKAQEIYDMPLSEEHSDPGSLKEQENSTREGTLITVPVAQGWEENSRDMQTGNTWEGCKLVHPDVCKLS